MRLGEFAIDVGGEEFRVVFEQKAPYVVGDNIESLLNGYKLMNLTLINCCSRIYDMTTGVCYKETLLNRALSRTEVDIYLYHPLTAPSELALYILKKYNIDIYPLN